MSEPDEAGEATLVSNNTISTRMDKIITVRKATEVSWGTEILFESYNGIFNVLV